MDGVTEISDVEGSLLPDACEVWVCLKAGVPCLNVGIWRDHATNRVQARHNRLHLVSVSIPMFPQVIPTAARLDSRMHEEWSRLALNCELLQP
jgi:hypothetical protein